MNLKSIGEFGLIAAIKEQFAALNHEGVRGIGDDCAVIPLSATKSLVITTDMLVESKHFLLDKISPYELGYKSLAVNISDVAAMGAKPYVSLLSLALSDDISQEWTAKFSEGYHDISKQYGIALIGGDTTAAPTGGVAISVTAIGVIDNDKIKYRSGASVGDIVAVTAPLGASSMALKLILEGGEPPKKLLQAHYMPEPMIYQGEWLSKEVGVTAMMDISDGVASDIRHISTLSGCGIEIDIKAVPICEEVDAICKARGWNPESFALSGGEEYSLLITVNSDTFEDIKYRYMNHFGCGLYPIGRCVEGNSISYINATGDINDGFTHF